MQQLVNKKRWIWILIIIYVGIIFHFSLQSADVSNESSFFLTDIVLRILQNAGFSCDYFLLNHYVRKLAHFSEYAGLGFLIFIAIHVSPVTIHSKILFLLFLFIIPFSDECLQMLSFERSCQFSDMVLDGCGYLFGGFICYVLWLIYKDLFTKKPLN